MLSIFGEKNVDNNNMNNNNNNRTGQCLWCWRHDSESLRKFARFTRWMQNSARRLPTFGPSRRTWAVGPPVVS